MDVKMHCSTRVEAVASIERENQQVSSSFLVCLWLFSLECFFVAVPLPKHFWVIRVENHQAQLGILARNIEDFFGRSFDPIGHPGGIFA